MMTTALISPVGYRGNTDPIQVNTHPIEKVPR